MTTPSLSHYHERNSVSARLVSKYKEDVQCKHCYKKTYFKCLSYSQETLKSYNAYNAPRRAISLLWDCKMQCEIYSFQSHFNYKPLLQKCVRERTHPAYYAPWTQSNSGKSGPPRTPIRSMPSLTPDKKHIRCKYGIYHVTHVRQCVYSDAILYMLIGR